MTDRWSRHESDGTTAPRSSRSIAHTSASYADLVRRVDRVIPSEPNSRHGELPGHEAGRCVLVTDRRQDPGNLTRQSAADRSGSPHLGSDRAELIDRLEKLRILLPAFAQETAAARREAARLRSENAMLHRRLVQLETRSANTRDTTGED
jgi:hypothetical protein